MTEQCQHAPLVGHSPECHQDKVRVLNLHTFKGLDPGSDTILSPSLQPACKSLFRTIFQELDAAGQVFTASQETPVSRNEKA